MRYGFVITTGDPRAVAEFAREVEDAGWDGAFYWDGICVGEIDTYDPWVVMAAMAMRTERVRIGAVLTPPVRRRPWKLARETVALDHLSGGRLVLPVGLGALDDGGFAKVGEPTDRRVRARLLDESLEILTGLWSGEPFSYEGEHYRIEEMTFLPPPVLPVKNHRYTAGVFDVGPGRTLYISRGVGHLTQVRFNVRPEMTLFTLQRA